MDKKPHIKPYIYGMLAGFGAISLSILFFFFIYRFDGFGDAVSKVTGILMPFIYGAVIAYLLKPVCNTIEGFLHRIFPEKLHSMANMLAIAATLLFGVLVVYALVMMVVPQLITSVTSLYYTAQTSIARFMRWVNTQKVFLDNETLMGYFNNAYDVIVDNLTTLRTTLLPSLQNLQGILSGVGVGVMNVVIWFKNLLIGLIVAVYLLASRKKFAKQAKMILYSVVKPRWAQLIQEEVLYADKMFGGFINGKIMDSAIIGVLCYFACIIFKFPSALLVSVIIGVTNVIPFFGPFIGAVPATLLILIQSPIKALWFVLFVLVLQQLDGNVIGPKILGNTTGLSSFWVMFAILIFGGLFGGRQGQRRHRVHIDHRIRGFGHQFAAVAVLPAPCPAEHIFRRRIIIDDFAGLRVLQHVGLAERHIVFGTVRNAEAQIALDDVPVVAPARQQIFQTDAVEDRHQRIDERKRFPRTAALDEVDHGRRVLLGFDAHAREGFGPCFQHRDMPEILQIITAHAFLTLGQQFGQLRDFPGVVHALGNHGHPRISRKTFKNSLFDLIQHDATSVTASADAKARNRWWPTSGPGQKPPQKCSTRCSKAKGRTRTGA